MKKKGSVFAWILLLLLSFCTPAMAATEFGVIYDETDELASQPLQLQGEETLPQLSEKLGIDLRVDVLTMIGSGSILDNAEGIYEEYGYGYGEKREGATLTILLEPLDTGGYAMPENGWCVYANLSEERGGSQGLADAIRAAVEPSMVERAWNGEDMTMSATALTQVVDAMAVAAEDYILANSPPAGEEADAGDAENTGEEESQAPAEGDVEVNHVFDESGLLTWGEWEELEKRAETISQEQGCGVYFVLVDDYTEYGDGSVYEVTYQLYHDNQLGVGEDRDGIIVLLSMAERDYAMFVYGEYGQYAFDEFGQEQLEERFLGTFGDDDWYGGITKYLDACDEFLTKAAEGKPVRPSRWGWYLIAVGISFGTAGIICLVLLRPMKTVHQQTEADEYLADSGLHLTEQYDRFTHTTVVRRKIEKQGSGSSGSSSESGGGGSGRSGKF